jgi:hypothetical protein
MRFKIDPNERIKIGTKERTRRDWFFHTLFCWFLVVAIFAAIRFL